MGWLNRGWLMHKVILPVVEHIFVCSTTWQNVLTPSRIIENFTVFFNRLKESTKGSHMQLLNTKSVKNWLLTDKLWSFHNKSACHMSHEIQVVEHVLDYSIWKNNQTMLKHEKLWFDGAHCFLSSCNFQLRELKINFPEQSVICGLKKTTELKIN